MAILALTGASGVGKTTQVKRLAVHFGGGRVVTMTDRSPRPGETECDYKFKTLKAIQCTPDLLWIHRTYNNHYASDKSSFEDAFRQTDGTAILSVVPHLHKTLRSAYPDQQYVGIHLLSPGDSELRRRLQSRPDTSDIENRIKESHEMDTEARAIPGIHLVEPASIDETFATIIAHSTN